MRALICHSAKDLRIETTELPNMGPDQVRVKVAFGGICGSDLHYYQHGGFGTVRIKQPMALGHEISGVVSALGANVKHLTVGQRIAISPSRPCGSCRFCQLGQQNHCLNMRFFGSAMPFPHIQGAFAEQLVIEAYQAHAIGQHLSLSEAALAEPLSVGLHAIQRAGGVLGKQVFVTGCGPIGSLLIGALRRAGAARIAGGYAGLTVLPEGMEIVTAEYKINFLSGHQEGELRAVGKVVKGGKRIVVTTVEVFHIDAQGKQSMCAVMQQTLVPVPQNY